MNSLEEFQVGKVLLIDKPLNWTSFQVVNKIRHLIKRKFKIKKIKVGHAGTLDPLATGLLIVCTGKATKGIQEIQNDYKVYTGSFFIGATTPSYDLETEVDKTYNTTHINSELIERTKNQFLGSIMQTPPIFSALKVEGKKAYDIARKGENVKLNPREINIYEFEILNSNLSRLEFRIKCSKGTYIRSIAHDFGKALNSGGYLSSLRREEIGDYKIEQSISIEEFEKTIKEQ